MSTSALDRGSSSLLTLAGLRAGYGGFDVLRGIDLEVRSGEIVGIIGPNGSGKSTIFKAVFGLISARDGEVRFDGEPIIRRRPQHLLRQGIAMVPQLSTVFADMTVDENLELGMYLEPDKRVVRERLGEIYDMFPRLAERRHQKAGSLSGGERRSLEIARAFMLRPRLLLMDEPSVGLAPVLVRDLFEDVRRLRDEVGATVLMIEQNVRSALNVCDRAYVVQRGTIIREGASDELVRDEGLSSMFFGRVK